MEHIKIVCKDLEQGKKMFEETLSNSNNENEEVQHKLTFYSSGMGRYFADIFTNLKQVKIIIPYDNNDRIGDLFEEGDTIVFCGDDENVLRKPGEDDREDYFVSQE